MEHGMCSADRRIAALFFSSKTIHFEQEQWFLVSICQREQPKRLAFISSLKIREALSYNENSGTERKTQKQTGPNR